MQIDVTAKIEEDISLKYTKEIIGSLKKKMRSFNANSESKVTFAQLKSLFLEGAQKNDEKNHPVLSGFARVNMFLRILKDKTVVNEFKASKDSYIHPNELDYITASLDLNLYQLNFVLENIDELYLTDVDEISFLESYL